MNQIPSSEHLFLLKETQIELLMFNRNFNGMNILENLSSNNIKQHINE